MRTRGIILTILALFFAGGAFLMARAWLSAQSAVTPLASAPAAAHAVLVAHDRLPLGQIIRPSDLVWQSWPDGDYDNSYVAQGTHNPADFAGWVVRSAVGKGEPITLDKIVAPGDRGFFSAVLRTGMRAVSIAVDATSGIAGFVFPGDQVDILLTHTLPSDDTAAPHRATETILQDVRVLAIDQKVTDKQSEPVVVHDVTVEVTPKQSEMIAVATAMGKLSLSLRSIARNDAAQPGDLDNGLVPVADGEVMPIADRKHQSYTLDSQASRLLGNNGGFEQAHVTVLHGGQTEEVVFGAGATHK